MNRFKFPYDISRSSGWRPVQWAAVITHRGVKREPLQCQVRMPVFLSSCACQRHSSGPDSHLLMFSLSGIFTPQPASSVG